MKVWRYGAAAVLRLITRARRWPLVAAIYACMPPTWKVRGSRMLLRSALGTGQVPADRGSKTQSERIPDLPQRRSDPRFAGTGVNLCGYVHGEFGLGESVRMFAQALAQAGFPFALMDFPLSAPARNEEHSLDGWISGCAEHPVSVYFVNPDQMQRTGRQFEADRQEGRYLIGFWFWELEHFPNEWKHALELVDEVWVASAFVQRAVSAVTNKPVLRMPLPIDLSGIRPDRARFKLPDGRFVFLYAFDYHSYPQRKNPEAAIAAFRAAFSLERDDVRLVVKTINAERVADAHLRLIDAARGDRRISFRDEHLSRTEMYQLIASADAYVSLHRAEGFGLGLAEAMYFGKPVIATGYSGNLDFMSQATACLVRCAMVDVPPGAYPHWQSQRWADPDIEEAAKYMRYLADNPEGAQLLGAAAGAQIRRQYAPSVCAAATIGRLQAIAGGCLEAAAALPPRTPAS